MRIVGTVWSFLLPPPEITIVSPFVSNSDPPPKEEKNKKHGYFKNPMWEKRREKRRWLKEIRSFWLFPNFWWKKSTARTDRETATRSVATSGRLTRVQLIWAVGFGFERLGIDLSGWFRVGTVGNRFERLVSGLNGWEWIWAVGFGFERLGMDLSGWFRVWTVGNRFERLVSGLNGWE